MPTGSAYVTTVDNSREARKCSTRSAPTRKPAAGGPGNARDRLGALDPALELNFPRWPLSARTGHDGQLANASAVRCSHARQHTFACQSRQEETVVGSALIGSTLNCPWLSCFLDNIPYGGVIRKQRQQRLAIRVSGRSWLGSYPETRQSLVSAYTEVTDDGFHRVQTMRRNDAQGNYI